MILYYTTNGKTKVFAEALAALLGLPVVRLTSRLESRSKFSFLLRAFFLIGTEKEYPVDDMPVLSGNELYVCGPVWGGKLPAPLRYFLRHADLKGRTVHFLLTCAGIDGHEKYRANALNVLAPLDCAPGKAYVFAVGKEPPDAETVTAQLRVMLDAE